MEQIINDILQSEYLHHVLDPFLLVLLLVLFFRKQKYKKMYNKLKDKED